MRQHGRIYPGTSGDPDDWWETMVATNRRAPVRAHLGLCCLIRSPRGPFRRDVIVPLYRWYRRYAW